MVMKKFFISKPRGIFFCAATLLLVCEGPRAISARGEDLAAGEIEVMVSAPQVVYSSLPCITEIFVQNNIPKVACLSKEEILAMQEEERREYFNQLSLSNLKIPEYGLLSDHPPPFSVEIVDRAGKTAVPPIRPGLASFFTANAEQFNPPGDPMDYMRPHFSVRLGQQGSLIVDLQPWMQALKPGEYRLTVTMYPGGRLGAGRGGTLSWKSEPVEFRVKRVSAGVRRTIRRAFPALTADRPDEPDWFKSLEPWQKPYSWGSNRPPSERLGWLKPAVDLERLRDELPDEVLTSLAVYSFLSGSIKVEPDAEPPVELLDSLPDHLQDFAGVLLYESLLVKGDEPAAAELRQRLLDERPDLKWQLDRPKKGNGLMQQAIRLTKPRTSQKEGESPSGKEDGRDGNDEP